VLDVTATGVDLATARARAYDAVAQLSWDGMQFRRDIAASVAERQGGAASEPDGGSGPRR
jgi:phosphoribosylamine---glycine ligase